MDVNSLSDWWENLRLVWAGLGLCLAAVTAGVVWRVRGLLNWKRSLRQELAELRRWRDRADTVRAGALGEVITACEAIWYSTSPDIDRVAELPAYWRRIAACYHPEESQPELCLSIGQLLAAAQELTAKLDALLQRPGFDRLGRLRIRQLRRTYDWYRQFNAHPVIAWIMARRRTLRAFWHTLRFVMPDPLAWMAYLSHRLTVMLASRCLLVDVYLFTGKCAIDAFDAQRRSAPSDYGARAADTVIDAYETAFEEASRPMTGELEAIRNDLTGIPGRLLQPPGVDEWCRAVQKAAGIIAADHFPEATSPLEEATCRVLLDRGRYWLEAMAAARRMPVIRPLYRISLKRLVQIKTITESDLLRRTGKVAAGAWSAWRWARWPLKVLRWARRRSPAGVAVDLGFTLAGKAVLNFLARYGFDRACRELDCVYRLSRARKPNPAPDKDQG